MPSLPIASQTAARRCGTGPCSHSGPSAGVHVDQTDASLSAEVTSSPTAIASKTSRSVTSSELLEEEVDRAGAGQRRLQRERDDAAERASAPKSRSANTGHRRRRSSSTANTGWRVSCAAVQGPSPTVNCRRSAVSASSRLRPERHPLPARVDDAEAGPVDLEHLGARPGQPDRQQLGALEAGLVRRLSSAASKRAAMVTPHYPAGATADRRFVRPSAARLPGSMAGVRRDDDAACRRRVDVLPYGDRALLVEVADLAGVAAVRPPLERSPLPGQRELVPAARTVLVLLDRAAGRDRRRRALRRLAPAPPPPAPDGPPVELPVVFDGPDLAEVAELTGRSVPALVGALTGVEFTVAFSGFAPGFGYLTGLPEELHVPRRATPRTRVPAGSVGLAGPYAGAYPRPSPGGWQLVGRTDAVLFDVDRDPPALLAARRPGAVPGGGLSADRPGARSARDGPGRRPRRLGVDRRAPLRRRRPGLGRARQPARRQPARRPPSSR